MLRNLHGAPGYGVLLTALLGTTGAAAVPPDPWSEEQLEVRLFLGRLDGAENSTVLHDDGHRYTVGLGASSPVAWNGRVQANLEGWVTERGYDATITPSGVATESLTLQAAALAYGLRLHWETGAVRPYGLAALGFQATRLRAGRRDQPAVEAVDEEILEPVVQLGAGLEWRVGRDLFSLDWRRWYGTGDFSQLDTHDLNLGGDYLGLGLGHRW